MYTVAIYLFIILYFDTVFNGNSKIVLFLLNYNNYRTYKIIEFYRLSYQIETMTFLFKIFIIKYKTIIETILLFNK